MSFKTPLRCGHLTDGLHRGPWAWCDECTDWVQVGRQLSPRARARLVREEGQHG